jgi:hypothetical protein
MFFKRLSLATREKLCQCVPYRCRRSSVVEHTLGKGEVESSILSGGTITALILTVLSAFSFGATAQELTEAACKDIMKRARNNPNYSPELSASKHRPANLESHNQLPPSLQVKNQNFMGHTVSVKASDLNPSSSGNVPEGLINRCKKLYPTLK